MMRRLALGWMLPMSAVLAVSIYVLQPEFAMDRMYLFGWSVGLVAGWISRSWVP